MRYLVLLLFGDIGQSHFRILVGYEDRIISKASVTGLLTCNDSLKTTFKKVLLATYDQGHDTFESSPT